MVCIARINRSGHRRGVGFGLVVDKKLPAFEMQTIAGNASDSFNVEGPIATAIYHDVATVGLYDLVNEYPITRHNRRFHGDRLAGESL